LSIDIQERESGVLFTVAGEIDLVTSTQLKRAFDDVVEDSPPPARLTADLTLVEFMDTSGVAVLLTAGWRAEEVGSRFVVSGLSPSLARLFEITGISRVQLDEQG
jgi:anti-sigma B factor antagonist